MSEDTTTNPVEGDAPLPEAGVDPSEIDLNTDLALDPEEGQSEEDPADEFDIDGKKITVPKSVKTALEAATLRHADYTRKTQEVAESRKALEEQQTAVRQQAEQHQAFLGDFAELTALQKQLSDFEKADWTALRAQYGDAEVNDAQFRFTQLQRQAEAKRMEIGTKIQQRQQEQERATANLVQQRDAELKKDIPGWSPELSGKLADRATRAGFSKAEFDNSDARAIKILHRLSVLENREAQRMRTANAEKQASSTPAQTVRGGNASAARDPEKMSADEWAAWRNKEIADKRKRAG